MGRYIEWTHVAEVYPVLSKGGLAPANVNTAFIVRCEAYVEGMLSNNFTSPFSSNNMTVRNLCIDYVYMNVAVNKDKNIKNVEKRFNDMIMALNNGAMNMIADDGSVIERATGQQAWSNTMSYHTSFGVDSYHNWETDDNQILDDKDMRD